MHRPRAEGRAGATIAVGALSSNCKCSRGLRCCGAVVRPDHRGPRRDARGWPTQRDQPRRPRLVCSRSHPPGAAQGPRDRPGPIQRASRDRIRLHLSRHHAVRPQAGGRRRRRSDVRPVLRRRHGGQRQAADHAVRRVHNERRGPAEARKHRFRSRRDLLRLSRGDARRPTNGIEYWETTPAPIR